MVKTSKTSPELKSYDLKTWHAASGTKALQSKSTDTSWPIRAKLNVEPPSQCIRGQKPNQKRQLTVHPKIISVTKTTFEVIWTKPGKSISNLFFRCGFLHRGENLMYFTCSIVSLTNHDPMAN